MPRKTVFYNQEDNSFVFECPNCSQIIQVLENEVMCSIFRCGILKSNLEQINPHAPKVECDRLTEEDLIFGCGKPFKIFKGVDRYVEECDYI